MLRRREISDLVQDLRRDGELPKQPDSLRCQRQEALDPGLSLGQLQESKVKSLFIESESRDEMRLGPMPESCISLS